MLRFFFKRAQASATWHVASVLQSPQVLTRCRAANLSYLDTFRYSKARRCSVLALPHDLLRHIALHLKPKLMMASKRLLRIVDCDSYWERAAAHAVLRHGLEIEPGANQLCRFAKRRGLFNLVNVDYSKGIDCIIQRARQVFGGDLDVAELVRAGEAIVLMDPDNYVSIHAAYACGAATMKEVLKPLGCWRSRRQWDIKFGSFNGCSMMMENCRALPRHT